MVDNIDDSSKRFILKFNGEYVAILRVRKNKYQNYSNYVELGLFYLLDSVKKQGYGKNVFIK